MRTATRETDRQLLTRLYRDELLADPPIASLADGAVGREDKSWHFARKDIGRAFKAAEAAGLEITLRKPEAVQLALDEEPETVTIGNVEPTGPVYVGAALPNLGRLHVIEGARTRCRLPLQPQWVVSTGIDDREVCRECDPGAVKRGVRR